MRVCSSKKKFREKFLEIEKVKILFINNYKRLMFNYGSQRFVFFSVKINVRTYQNLP